MTKIKICGITNIEDAEFTARQGANFIGFIFYPPSTRFIEPVHASEIVRNLRHEMGKHSPRFVGVFVDASVQKVKKIREQVGLDLLQLHGSESPDVLRILQPGAFKALRPTSIEDVQNSLADYVASLTLDNQTPEILIDAYHPTEKGGTGQLPNIAIAEWLAQRYRMLLAGGLNPENVASIIKTVQPWGVDVSSGVEVVREGKSIKGSKDHNKIKAFIQAVHSA